MTPKPTSPPPKPPDPIGPETVTLDKWEMSDKTAEAVRRIHTDGLAEAGQTRPPK